jgi:sulfur relay (sulfurtransferase) complex TusBCD TusD component (DsrE family)
MKLAIIISTKNPEIIWNAYRLGIFCLGQGDEATIFLINDGVESEYVKFAEFQVDERIKEFVDLGGKMFACKTCLDRRQIDIPRFASIANLAKLREIVDWSDKVVSF